MRWKPLRGETGACAWLDARHSRFRVREIPQLRLPSAKKRASNRQTGLCGNLMRTHSHRLFAKLRHTGVVSPDNSYLRDGTSENPLALTQPVAEKPFGSRALTLSQILVEKRDRLLCKAVQKGSAVEAWRVAGYAAVR